MTMAEHLAMGEAFPTGDWLVCPECGEMTNAPGQGCLNCWATEEDIAHLEPGPWDRWG